MGGVIPSRGTHDRRRRLACFDSVIETTYNDSGIRIRAVETVDGGTPKVTEFVIDAQNHTGYAQVLEEYVDGTRRRCALRSRSDELAMDPAEFAICVDETLGVFLKTHEFAGPTCSWEDNNIVVAYRGQWVAVEVCWDWDSYLSVDLRPTTVISGQSLPRINTLVIARWAGLDSAPEHVGALTPQLRRILTIHTEILTSAGIPFLKGERSVYQSLISFLNSQPRM